LVAGFEILEGFDKGMQLSDKAEEGEGMMRVLVILGDSYEERWVPRGEQGSE
jgi:hypothetical protein